MSVENMTRAAQMQNFWKADLNDHLMDRSEAGSDPHHHAYWSMRNVSSFLMRSGVLKKEMDDSFSIHTEAAESLPDKDKRQFGQIYSRLLSDYDRVSPELRSAGFGKQLDGIEEARTAAVPSLKRGMEEKGRSALQERVAAAAERKKQEKVANRPTRKNELDFFGHL